MPTLDTVTNTQRLADAAAQQDLQMWKAAETVRLRTPEGAVRDELLACLGLTDVTEPEAL